MSYLQRVYIFTTPSNRTNSVTEDLSQCSSTYLCFFDCNLFVLEEIDDFRRVTRKFQPPVEFGGIRQICLLRRDNP